MRLLSAIGRFISIYLLTDNDAYNLKNVRRKKDNWEEDARGRDVIRASKTRLAPVKGVQ